MFEAAGPVDMVTQGGQGNIDYYTRNRLNAKIMGNTTPRQQRVHRMDHRRLLRGVPARSGQFLRMLIQVGAEMTISSGGAGSLSSIAAARDAWDP